MVEEMVQDSFSLAKFSGIPEIPVAHISPPSKSSSSSSSDDNSPFSAISALQSNSTTPSVTPDPALGVSDATSKFARHSLVGHQGSVNSAPVNQWQPQTAKVAFQQQAAPMAQYYSRPQVQPSRLRPYPDEIYAQAYVPPSAHHAAQAMPPNDSPAGMHPPGMVHPGTAMGMGMSMVQAGVIPQRAHPGAYVPWPIGSYSPYQYGYAPPQHQYCAPVPQAANALASYPMHSAQGAPPPPSFPIHHSVALRAGQVQAAPPPPAQASQMLVHQGPLIEGPSIQVEGIINGLPPNFASYYNPGEGGAQRAENVQAPVAQPHFPPQMQGQMTPEHNAAIMGQEMAYPNAVVMQLPASTGSSSVPSSSGNGEGKGKRRASDNDDAPSKPKRTKHPRLHPDHDPNFKNLGDGDKGQALYRCLLPQCAHTKPMQEGSVDAHRKSDRHSQVSGKYPCQYCGKGFSRKDARKRHETSTEECKKLREKTTGSTAVADEPGPSTASGNTTMTPIPVPAPSGPFTFEAPRPGPNSMQRQATPPSVSAVSYTPTVQPTTWRRAAPMPTQQQVPPVPVSTQAMSMPLVQFTAQAPIVQPRGVLQATSGPPPLPVFVQATSILAVRPATQVPRAETCPVPQAISGAHPLPVIAQDFFSVGPTRQLQQASVAPPPPVIAAHFDISTDAAEDDGMDDLFDSLEMLSPEMTTSLPLPLAPAVEETTADAPVVQTAPADAPAPFSFDLAALDLSFDDWMGNGEQPLPDAFANPDVVPSFFVRIIVY
ncbi:hypothetical protein AZE42_10403 [Rhizopogon vesiculosus]|uniref:C2H2-type domain-containing protein n=1 Tax=Rhizopogon vesiculosus TaxID=180088 RepID=A0A1J8QZK4_9AGAM|nr:hypothetical protein AZE42_10403 [Rhizopogon vesiculosus]